MDVTRRIELTDRLIDWYWSEGRRRDPAFRLSPDWITDIYRHRDTIRALGARSGSDQKTVAIWGPSQAGKSTMLSYFLDDPDGPNSALTWQGGEPFRFQFQRGTDPSTTSLGAYNPYNLNSDASGCVTCFRMAETVADPRHPVTIEFLSRAQVMQAVSAGYFWECRLDSPNRPVRNLDENEVRNLLNRWSVADSLEPDREAVEFLVDVVGAVNRLIEDGTPRWQNLNFNNIWHAELVRAIFANPGLVSRLENAQSFAYDLLWDDHKRLNELFANLVDYAGRLQRRFGGKPVTCSLKFAALLVDIDSYTSVVSHQAASEVGRTETMRRQLQSVTWREGDNCVAISLGDDGKSLFDNLTDFGLFQALVWELDLPLSAQYLSDRSPEIAEFFKQTNVLDVPGVSQFDRSEASQLIDLDADVDEGELLIKVVKRGKTFTIINRYAHELRVDLLLLLSRVMKPVSKPEQLIAGTRAIWREIDRGYDPSSRKPPPVPVVFGLTFMAQIFTKVYESGKSDLQGIERMVEQLGPIADPNVADMMATTYPQYDEGRVNLEQAERTKVFDKLAKETWTQRHFGAGDPQGSLNAAMFSEDGGVLYLLKALTNRLSDSRTEQHLARRLDTLIEDIGSRIEMALPIHDDTGDQHREAIGILLQSIQGKLDEEVVQGDEDPAIMVSHHLRRLMAFSERDFSENVPMNLGQGHDPVQDREVLRAYLSRQLGRWTERTEANDALRALGLPEDQHLAVMHALSSSVDVESVIDWAQRSLRAISTEQVARQARRYLAACCAETLLARPGLNDMNCDPNAQDFQNLASRFGEWTASNRQARHSPHYAKIIEPILDSLINVSEQGVEFRWSEQPGDQTIEALANEWRNAREGGE